MLNDSILVLGGGASIPFDDNEYKNSGCGFPKELTAIIQNSYSIGLNYFYKYGCPTTLNTFVDAKFYLGDKNDLNSLPLVIGKQDKLLATVPNNIILFPIGKHYMGEHAWNIKYKMCQQCGTKVLLSSPQNKCHKCPTSLFPCGFFHSHLNGVFSLSFAIALGFKNIYLLGYDGCLVNDKTHFYQNQVQDMDKFRGVGIVKHPKGQVYRTSTYNSPDKMNKIWFAPFKDLNINIYNVSPTSVIEVFPKITYEQFYKQVAENQAINQDQARLEIKDYIKKKIGEVC